ncbi:unnamed protein product, partial [Cuscuta europaea]
MATVGGISGEKDQNSLDFEDHAKFAVSEQNKKENSNLKFEKVVSVKQQVVAGTIHHIMLEATDKGTNHKKVYEAKVWEKPWMDFKKLQDFKAIGEA